MAATSISRAEPVHPRGRGEQNSYFCHAYPTCGSSPRTRGTGELHCRGIHRHRFIPADAGNSGGPFRRFDVVTVHPRGRGEQPRNNVFFGPPVRFIPADAGNSLPGGQETQGCRGSSPRTRGTGHGGLLLVVGLRFIPADAGNSRVICDAQGSQPVHPRGRGEQRQYRMKTFTGIGSSPRTRGTALDSRPVFCGSRFIPADAGNRFGHQIAPSSCCGSSPRTRGTVRSERLTSDSCRFIPADAGNRLAPAP